MGGQAAGLGGAVGQLDEQGELQLEGLGHPGPRLKLLDVDAQQAGVPGDLDLELGVARPVHALGEGPLQAAPAGLLQRRAQ
ncbi:MAG: hypothetical protein ACK559_38105, partial [bacterium]